MLASSELVGIAETRRGERGWHEIASSASDRPIVTGSLNAIALMPSVDAVGAAIGVLGDLIAAVVDEVGIVAGAADELRAYG